jgi:hypothetical protein
VGNKRNYCVRLGGWKGSNSHWVAHMHHQGPIDWWTRNSACNYTHSIDSPLTLLTSRPDWYV